MKYKKSAFFDYCSENKYLFILLVFMAAAVSVFLYMSENNKKLDYITIDGENVISVDMNSLPDEMLSLDVKGTYKDSTLKKRVVLKHTENKSEETNYVMSDEEMLSNEISQIVRDINRADKSVVYLPSISPEGTELVWEIPEEGKNYIVPLFFPLLIMAFLYRGELEKNAKEAKSETEIIVRELPSFNNKIVLLMESGLIYEEAIRRVCSASSCESGLNKVFSDAITESELTNERTEKIITEFAREKKIADLSRFISIVSESITRGTDLREKLTNEGNVLWDKRKKKAEEIGKLVDTKLALPLSMMLISLLIITAAPAMMQF